MNFNDKIGQSLRLRERKEQAVGIELEFENWNGEQPPMKYWTFKRDDSLRNAGVEYCSNILTEKVLDNALSEFAESLSATRARCHTRCGTHVHLNMLPYTWNNLWSLSVLYTLLEPTIFYQFARSRINNHFCVPSYCNNQLINALMNDGLVLREGMAARPRERQEVNIPLNMNEVRRVVRWDDDPDVLMEVEPQNQINNLRIFNTSKYSAMNYSRLRDLGTVELRQLETTQDTKLIREWVMFLLRLQRKANTYDDPLRVLDDYERRGLPSFCYELGMRVQEVPEEDQDEAEDAATFMAGYVPPKWEDLDWSLQPQQAGAV